MHTNKYTIYVKLLDEGTNVLRPTLALLIRDNEYQILEDSTYDPEIELWEFPPGTRILCEYRNVSGKLALVACGRSGGTP